MTTFYVGQRVRVARPDSGSLLRGLASGDEATIIERGDYVDFRVAVAGKRNPNHGLDFFPVWARELEPFTDPGRQLVAWSECLWQPQGVAA